MSRSPRRAARAGGLAGVRRLATRSAGLLLHPTSLAGPYGSGDLGPEARRFVELLAALGQSWWQMLPVGPPGIGNSPYSALSACAGSPLLVSPEMLVEDGLLDRDALAGHALAATGRVDYTAAAAARLRLLRAAFDAVRARLDLRVALAAWAASQRHWLDDWTLFAALRDRHGDASWTTWEPALRNRTRRALERARAELASVIEFHQFVQWQFDRQWSALRAHAARHGIGLIGDLPFYVAHDSADVWAHPEVFHLDRHGMPRAAAGVPPDAFSATGQLWGNPLYRWSTLRRTRHAWWVARVRRTLERFDAVRLDHFIGFHRVWRVPADAPTAERGRWELTPGRDLLTVLRRRLGGLPFIAEDLGLVTSPVSALRDRFGLPGIRVLQFAFGGDPHDIHLPHTYPRRVVACTGTHDHDSIVGWFRGVADDVRARVLRYLGTDGREIHWDMIRLAMTSVADTVILPVQDVLGLGSDARMNVPATATGNWEWRLLPDQFCRAAGEPLAELTRLSGRARPAAPTGAARLD